MEPDGATGAQGEPSGAGPLQVLPSVRQHLPSLAFGAVLPICAFFVARRQVGDDTTALIVAGCFSAGWILVQFARQRRVDAVGAVVLAGFAVGIATSTLLGGNAYVLKAREAFLTALFGVVCIVTVFTHDRPALFYVSRYLTAGSDPEQVAAYDRLYELPASRRAFRVLSAAWGVGLVFQASLHLVLAYVLPTGVFLAVSPVVTACVIGGLFAFSIRFTRKVRGTSPHAAAPLTSAPDGDRSQAARATAEGSKHNG